MIKTTQQKVISSIKLFIEDKTVHIQATLFQHTFQIRMSFAPWLALEKFSHAYAREETNKQKQARED